MSGICDKCRREPCRMRMDGLKICDLYEGGETNWERLFSTPERAARTLETVADSLFSSAWSDDNATLSDVMCALAGKCDECVAQSLPGRGVSTKCGEVDYDAILEWLRGDAEWAAGRWTDTAQWPCLTSTTRC